MLNPSASSNKFAFEYNPYPYYFRSSSDKKRQCPVEIQKKDDGVTVLITEPDSHAVNREIELDFKGIMSQLYRKKLSHVSLSKITWFKHDVRNDDGLETLSLATLVDGKVNFTLKEEIANYTISGLEFTETELIFKTGFYLKPSVHRLSLNRFPSLQNAKEDERGCTSHKHSSVLYFYHLKEKLVARDVVLFCGSTEKHPPQVSEPDFLYETPSPFLG